MADLEASLCDWGQDMSRLLSANILSLLRTKVLRAIYDHDREQLQELNDLLSPLASIPKKKKNQVGNPQTYEISTLAAMVRGILFILEEDDPLSALTMIHYGREILSIVYRFEKQGITATKKLIAGKWPLLQEPFTEARLSRILASLEFVGFLTNFFNALNINSPQYTPHPTLKFTI